jgi:MFS family permease
MMIALTLGAPFFVAFGALSNRIGRRNIMTLGFALAVITYWPVFTWLGTFRENPIVLTILVFYMVILVTMVYGPIAAFLVELFPARIRTPRCRCYITSATASSAGWSRPLAPQLPRLPAFPWRLCSIR